MAEQDKEALQKKAEDYNKSLGLTDPGNIESLLSGRASWDEYAKDNSARANNYTGNRPYDSQTGDAAEQRANAEADRRYAADGTVSNNGLGGNPSSSSMRSWVGSSVPGGAADSGLNTALGGISEALKNQNDLYKQMFDRQSAADTENKAKADSLYATLLGRAQQSTNIDPNDPNIVRQVNSYRAESERAGRNDIDRMAESQGPLGNLNAERRMVAEKTGQDVGGLRASLIGNELQNRRAEIVGALQGMQGMLTADQTQNLQKQIALLDNSIAEQQVGLSGRSLDIQRELGLGGLANTSRGLDIQDKLGEGGLSNDLMRIMLQNQQFNSDLGLRTENQYNYWNDPLRTNTTATR